MKKIRWGIISTGNIANRFASDFRFVDNADLIAVASRDIQAAERFGTEHNVPRKYGSYQELYDDPNVDAIYVATPHNYHFQNSIDAMKGGKAVLCEKPITINPKELELLIHAAQSSECYLMEGMWTYFLPAIVKAREWIDQGRIGKVLHVKSEFGFPVPFQPESRMYSPDLAGGVLLDMGIYNLASAWLFLGKEPAEIEVAAHKASTGVDDDVHVLYKYDDESASLHASFRCKLPNYTTVIGEEGFIQIPDFWMAKDLFLHEGNKCVDEYHDPRQSVGFEFEIKQVTEDLLNGKLESDMVTWKTSMILQKQMDSILEQIKEV